MKARTGRRDAYVQIPIGGVAGEARQWFAVEAERALRAHDALGTHHDFCTQRVAL
jgi:hypothetical protein